MTTGNREANAAVKPARVKVGPSLLAADFSRLGDEVRRVEDGGADFLHLDIMDGHFVPNLSYGIPVVEAVRRATGLELDTHLMLSSPERFLQPFRDAGADSLTVHLEAAPDPAELIGAIRDLGLGCGIAVNPATPIESLLPFVPDLDLVLIMSVMPGFGGQSFRGEVLPKTRDLSAWMRARSLTVPIEMDGGISPQNAAECRDAGVNLLVAGSSVFGADDAAAAIRAIRGSG